MSSILYDTEVGKSPVVIESASHTPVGGTGEWHLMLHTEAVCDPFLSQLNSIITGYTQYATEQLPANAQVRFARCFVSDAANQADAVRQAWEQLHAGQEEIPPLSIVQQPLLDGSKLAFWLYLSTPFGTAYSHLFEASRTLAQGDSESQMRTLLEQYECELEEKGCLLERDCLRTWLFVRDVDVNYAGVVKGRTENFLTQGMNPTTHYIASTGIEGQSADHKELVLMDAYSVKGLDRSQIQFLYAKTHLNPTYEYNVTFERGVSVKYGDRRHALISGTASINNLGEIMHPGDITLQTKRMWENVEMLLKEASCSYSDVAHLIVYLRDMADYTLVRALFDAEFPQIPTVFLLAPVCRPGWLIEMECMAVKMEVNPEYPAL